METWFYKSNKVLGSFYRSKRYDYIKGETFKEWNGEALITSLKDQSLRRIKFNKSNFINEKIIFKGNIGRIIFS